jgi:hypothetical protein
VGTVAKIIPFHNKTKRMLYLSWTSDQNAQQTTKSRVDMNVGVGIIGDVNAGVGYARERERKLVYKGEISLGPGQSSSVEFPTSKIFVTISTESGIYTGMPPCIFINRKFSAQNCAGYTIREEKFFAHGALRGAAEKVFCPHSSFSRLCVRGCKGFNVSHYQHDSVLQNVL